MTKEQAKEILWNRCQHTPETAEAIRVLSEERPQGEWIKDNSGNRFCSECGSSALYHEIGLKIESRFCPNCGADMRKGGAE